MILARLRPKGLCRRSNELDGNSLTVRLLEGERDNRLGVLAALKCHSAARWLAGAFALDLLVLGQFACGIGVPPNPLVQAAELVMSGGVFWLELNDRFELVNRVFEVA